MIKIIVADDHPAFIEGLAQFISQEDGIRVIGQANNGIQVLQMLKKEKPDVVLLDIKMPEMDGLEAAKQIQVKYPSVKTIILSNYNENGLVRRARMYGCAGYLLKDCGKMEIRKAIKTVYDGGVYFNPKNGRGLVNDVEPARLSKREKEVLALIATENCNRDIAGKLNVSLSTVRTHRERLMIKAGVKNTAGLIYWAMKNNLLD